MYNTAVTRNRYQRLISSDPSTDLPLIECVNLLIEDISHYLTGCQK